MMPKDQSAPNSPRDSQVNLSEDLLGNSVAPRSVPYRSLSAKRPRDPSHRKSVSFNDVPIVHEVPSHDAMRNSNCGTYRSWTYTDATPSTSVVPSFYSSQLLTPFNSVNPSAQKLHANRLSSTLYSATSTNTTSTRIPDWAIRARTPKSIPPTEETNTTNENNSIWNPPLIVVHTPDERVNKDTITIKPNNLPINNNSHTTNVQSTSLLTANQDNVEEKKHPYRSAIVPDIEHHRNSSFSVLPISDSAATYTSMISANVIQSSNSSNEQPTVGTLRAARARSATLPVTTTHPSTRTNDTVSITPFRTATNGLSTNGLSTSTRAVLRPTTIAFQCSQPASTTANNINGSTGFISSSINNNTNITNSSTSSSTTNTINRTLTMSSRYGSASLNASAAHARFVLPQNRTFSTSSIGSSAAKHASSHPSMDTTLMSTMTTQPTVPRPPPTAYPRSRSANVLSTRRAAAASPVIMIDNQTTKLGTTSSIHPTNNLYATSKRNPNVRQTYGSYYMHRVLLPTTIN